MQNVTPSPYPGGEDEDTAINLGAVVRTLWRGKVIIAATTLAAIALAVAYLSMRTATYQATASVLIDRGQASQLDIRTTLDSPLNESVVSSQITTLTSNRVLGAVVDELRLDREPAFVPPLRPPGGFSLGKVRLAIGEALEPLLGQVPYLTPTPSPPMSDAERADLHRRIAIATLAGRVRTAAIGSSYVIAVSASSRSPREAAALANAVVRAYIALERTSKLDASTATARWLSGQISTLEEQVKRSTEALNDFRIENGITDDSQIGQRGAEVDRLRASFADARQTREGLLTELAAAADDAARSESLRGRIAAIEAREKALAESVATAEAELARLVRLHAAFAQLERQALADQRLYERFLDETNEVGALESYQQADARIIADALVPLSPSNPAGKLVLMLAAVLGAGVGTAIVGARELLNTTFRTREELAEFVGRPVLGAVARLRGPASPTRILAALQQNPFSPFAESVRTLRVGVLQRRGAERSVVLVTSASAREGKSTTALLLARTAADVGRRVVVVDCDLRRSRLAANLSLKAKNCLEDVLLDDCDLDEAIVRLPDAGFDVIPAGRATRGKRVAPLDLLSSPVTGDLIEELHARYDLVVLDTPPVLAVTDAMVLAPHADSVLFVVRWRRTSHATVASAMRELRGFDVRVDGLIMTLVDRRAEAAHNAVPHHVYSA